MKRIISYGSNVQIFFKKYTEVKCARGLVKALHECKRFIAKNFYTKILAATF